MQSMLKGKWYQPENSTELVVPSRIQCRSEQIPKPEELALEVKFLRFIVGDSNASSKMSTKLCPFKKKQNKQEYFSTGYLETWVI